MYPKHKQAPMTRETPTLKWATFTYYSSSVRTITKLFRNTNVKVAYRTTNTIKNLLKPKITIKDIYDQSGVYQLSCNDCPLKYIGQTGRTFNTRYKEHIHAIRTNRQQSKYAEHILNTKHTNTIDATLKILRTEKKSQLLDTWERYHIYNLSKRSLHMNDTFAINITLYSNYKKQ
jgi:hypothetical protein